MVNDVVSTCAIVNIPFLSTFLMQRWSLEFFSPWLNSIRCYKAFIRLFQFVCCTSSPHPFKRNRIEVALFVSFSFFSHLPMFSYSIFVDRNTIQCPCPCSLYMFMTISLLFSLSFLYYILYASTFLFSLFPFCHLL